MNNPEERVTLMMARGTAVRWRRAVARGLCALAEMQARQPVGSPAVETLTLRRAELRALWQALSDAAER